MAIIRKQELKRLSKEELLKKLQELEFEQLKMKAQKGQATAGTKKLKEIRRTIARINAQLNQLDK